MAKVYISFLGIGSYKKEKDIFEYDPAIYELDGKSSSRTEFVQAAELELLGADRFDRVIIVATQKSFDTHFAALRQRLEDVGAKNITHLIIDDDMSAEGQWSWFEQILDHIEPGTRLTADLTHGFRSFPIVFSTAMNFLQKAKNIELEAVYYGAYDANRNLVPIVNMREFYVINEWAEAVSRLVEDADARKLAKVTETTPGFQAGELNDPELVAVFQDLTNAIRNVDVNNVAAKANAALELIQEKEKRASVTGKLLVKLVMDKFSSLTTLEPLSGLYDKAYFAVQLEIIRILLEHKLFMQAYTAMRELIGSIGMIGLDKVKVGNADGRGKRKFFAEVFVNMFQFEEDEWKFKGEMEWTKEKLLPYYNKLRSLGIEEKLREFSTELADYRNGFDHAWTQKAMAPADVEEMGFQMYGKLREVVSLLGKNNLLS